MSIRVDWQNNWSSLYFTGLQIQQLLVILRSAILILAHDKAKICPPVNTLTAMTTIIADTFFSLDLLVDQC